MLPRSLRFAGVLPLILSAACSGSAPEEDAGPADAQSMDGPSSSDGGNDAGANDAELRDARPGDGSSGDADAGNSMFPTLSDYRRCIDDTDCPVGLGGCVKELSYNRIGGGGTSTVTLSVSEIYAELGPNEGICTRTCTTDITACETLSLRDSTGAPVNFTCQVAAVDTSPYPNPAPAFPFDSELNLTDMIEGQPFAAICRPPFELDPAHGPDFCESCDDNSACSGVCWRFDIEAPADGTGPQGLCLTRAANGCPLGFEARDLDGTGEVCAPTLGTCGPCQDLDGDDRGAGHCVSSQVDCDDRNPAAYYDSEDPEHPFPAFCGAHDYNCNGLSDDSEQVGNNDYKSLHCEFCGDDADGSTVQAGTPAEAVLECIDGILRTQSCANPAQVHCTGDVRMTGCETTGDTGVSYFRDNDNDTYGDPNIVGVGCPGGQVPVGFVTDNTDCNDMDQEIRPGALDICDCWGDCDQPGRRVDNDCDTVFDEDVTAYGWAFDADIDGAASPGVGDTYCGAPFPGAVITDGSLDCNDMNPIMFGPHVRITDENGMALPLPVDAAPPRDALGELFVVATSSNAEVCDGLDNNCQDGIDDGVLITFYQDADGDTYGSDTVTQMACTATTGYVARGGDCADTLPDVNPGVAEVCNGVDDNCMNGTDEGVPVGATCMTGLLGRCAAGTETECTNGAYVCTPNVPPERFDNPDPITPDDEDCDGPETIVYVDPVGSDSNAGTQAAPVATIAGGLARAAITGATQLHVLSGAHNISAPIDIDGLSIDIVGGFGRAGNVWTFNGATTNIAHDGSAIGRAAVGVSADGAQATLAYITLQIQQSSDAGVDHYGVRSMDSSQLRLQNMTIDVAEGTDGATGGNGTNGADGVPQNVSVGSNPGLRVCDGINVRGGTGGSSFGPPEPGLGPSPGAAGPFGRDGGIGGSGFGGVGGQSLGPIVTSGMWQPDTAQTGQSGTPGSGGGGGGVTVGIGIQSGGGGSGACGGGPAPAGSAGGSSFALFSVSADGLQMDNVTLRARGGGLGGDGGRGGTGGRRGIGKRSLNFGAPVGGNGGSGGGGGGGPGGVGGSVFPIFHQGPNDLCSNLAITVVRETPGLPGAGGGAGAGGPGGIGAMGGMPGSTGLPGFQVDCFWSRPCTVTTDCGMNETCSAGFCYR